MKKYAVWVLIPVGFVVLQVLYNATEQELDLTEPKFLATDDAEIRFYNVRQLSYDRENRDDAGMRLFRYRRRPKWDSSSVMAQAALVISPRQDKAFVMLELLGLPNRDSVMLSMEQPDTTFSIAFGQGSMIEHFLVTGALYKTLDRGGKVLLTTAEGEEFPLLVTSSGRDAFLTSLDDFYKLVGLR
ncbi:MAG TPA: hypothetical protein DCR93_23985 [Cytophagales bacterium]|nr:hypothetical protein [Cytophagales bacterium]